MPPDHRARAELEAGLDLIRRSPADRGIVELIVRRPGAGEREVLEEGELNAEDGLAGDDWLARATRGDREPNADTQLTIMNVRVIRLLAGDPARWPPAGDQLYVDLDLSVDNLPIGTRLEVGSAIVAVTAPPHTGCAQFAERFGIEAARFVNSEISRPLRLRGLNARVVQPGRVNRGDHIRRL